MSIGGPGYAVTFGDRPFYRPYRPYYRPVYAPVYVAPPVVYAPPRVVYAPPARVVYRAPHIRHRVVVPAPIWYGY